MTTRKSKDDWHVVAVVMVLAGIGTGCMVLLPMDWKALAFLWWGASATYALLWILHGSDRDRGWCDCYFEQVEYQRRLTAKKHPRHRNGQYAAKTREVA